MTKGYSVSGTFWMCQVRCREEWRNLGDQNLDGTILWNIGCLRHTNVRRTNIRLYKRRYYSYYQSSNSVIWTPIHTYELLAVAESPTACPYLIKPAFSLRNTVSIKESDVQFVQPLSFITGITTIIPSWVKTITFWLENLTITRFCVGKSSSEFRTKYIWTYFWKCHIFLILNAVFFSLIWVKTITGWLEDLTTVRYCIWEIYFRVPNKIRTNELLKMPYIINSECSIF